VFDFYRRAPKGGVAQPAYAINLAGGYKDDADSNCQRYAVYAATNYCSLSFAGPQKAVWRSPRMQLR
jgi:hypothetical protein